MRQPITALAVLALVACQSGNKADAPTGEVDLLIRNGLLYDGSGEPGREADVAIDDGRFVFVGDGSGIRAARTIDAAGLVVAPGFIDPHTHSETDLASLDPKRRGVPNHLMQGVTTIFIGNDGFGPPAIGETFARFETQGVGVNVAAYVGFGGVRTKVVGQEGRAPTAAELAAMRQLVATSMCEGAIGLSTGLYYSPQNFSKTEEVIELAKEASRRGGFYDSHLRDESSETIGLSAAVDEAIRIGREAAMPVHIAHIKALGVDVQGQAPSIIAQIEAARAAGVDVTADQTPYEASGTSVLRALIPRWVVDAGAEATRMRLTDPALRERLEAGVADNIRRRGGPASLLIVSGPHAGKTLQKLSEEWSVTPVETAIRLARDGDPSLASFNMRADDIRAFMARPWVMTSSDSSAGHPRRYGTFPAKFANFVRANPVMDIATFVHRSSGLTAETFGLNDRGFVRTGYAADLVVLDPETYRSRADYVSPEGLAEGVRIVVVNGRLAVEDGAPTGNLAGRPLRHAPPRGSCP